MPEPASFYGENIAVVEWKNCNQYVGAHHKIVN